MDGFNDFAEDEQDFNLSGRDLASSIDSQNDIHSDTNQNADETEYVHITDANDRSMQKRVNSERSIKELEVIVTSLLQQKEKLTVIKKELENGLNDLTHDLKKTVKDSENYFLKFRKVYKKCESGLENFLQKAEIRIEVSNIPYHYQGNRCNLLPILSKNPAAYTMNLASAKVNFQEFQSLTECSFQKESNNKILNLATAIDKANITYSKLRSIVFYEE